MPQQQPPNTNPQPFDRVNQAQGLVQFPAMTVMVLMRRNLGYRLLSPFTLIATSILMIVVASAASPDARPNDLIAFALLSMTVGLYQRFKRWRAFRRGARQHSYYIGTSIILDSPRLSRLLSPNRRCERFLDPATCVLTGVLLIPHSALLGVWLFISGLCLKVFEDTVYRKELHQRLDLVDGLVNAEVHGQTMERFAEAPNVSAQLRAKAHGISTGLSADIENQIKQRRKNNERK